MIFNSIKNYLGWEECSLSLYSTGYKILGGNTAANPEILRYISQNYDINQRFFVHHNSEMIIDAAVCTWGNRVAGEKSIAKSNGIKIPLAFDEVLLPQKKNAGRIILPFSSKNLSIKHDKSLINASSKINAQREICIVKPLKGKSKQTLNRQTKQFLKNGGQIHAINKISNSCFYDIYSELFYKRRGKTVDQTQTRHFLNEFSNILFGCYLSYEGKPCVAQLIMRSEDNSTVYLDYINAGRDINHKFSIGSICMWENIKLAYDYSQSVNKSLRFNFGPPTHEYKDRFCVRQKLLRVIG